MADNATLSIKAVTKRFGGVTATDDVSFDVPAGSRMALIGPNGAGKTSLFNLISGLVPVSGGTIRLRGADVTGLRPEARAALGVARTFQNIRVFGAMTALENVLTGLHAQTDAGLPSVLGRSRHFRAEERRAVARARDALEFVGLTEKAEVQAGALSYGDQRRLEIARAMAPEPALLLLDEPAAGMNPAETAALGELVRRLRESRTTVLLVEHDMGFVMSLADHVTVLNFGRVIFGGAPGAARQDRTVIEAYLGPKVAARLAAAG